MTHLNVRKYPRLGAEVLTRIHSGNGFEILSSGTTHALVQFQQNVGWIPRNLLKTGQGRVRDGVSNLNVRQGPGPRDTVVTRVQGGQQFEVMSRSSDRIQIRFGAQEGWVHSRYTQEVQTVTSGLEVRSIPDSGDVLGTVREGDSVVLAENPDFIQIRLSSGTVGWIAASFVSDSAAPAAQGGEDANPEISSGQVEEVVTRLHRVLRIEEMLAMGNFLSRGGITPFRLRMGDQSSLLVEIAQAEFSGQFADERPYLGYTSLMRMMNSYPALLDCGGYVLAKLYQQAATCAESSGFPSRRANASEDAGEGVRILINLPSETLRVYDDSGVVKEFRIVIGHPDHSDNEEGDNSKSRVGDFKIRSWHQYYSNDEYPAWNEDPLRGAFGKFTAKLNDRHAQYLHGTHGSGIVDWAAIRLAPGSHGCIRCRNDDIEWLHSQAEAGTPVRKFYVTRQVKAYGSTFSLDEIDNPYGYTDIAENGYFYPGSGVLVNYRHPSDAITD